MTPRSNILDLSARPDVEVALHEALDVMEAILKPLGGRPADWADAAASAGLGMPALSTLFASWPPALLEIVVSTFRYMDTHGDEGDARMLVDGTIVRVSP